MELKLAAVTIETSKTYSTLPTLFHYHSVSHELKGRSIVPIPMETLEIAHIIVTGD